MNKMTKAIIPILVTAIFWFLPVPEGLTVNAMHYVAIFMGVIVALILEPLPGSAIGLIGVVLAATLQLVPMPDGKPATPNSSLAWALSGFVDSTVWLIFAAFMFAMGYEKTGLGKRIALMLIKALGKRALGLGYACALADMALAPFIPSNTARSAGSVYPVVKNIPPIYGSTPDNEPEKIGSYLMYTCLATTCVTSSMFFTGLAPNLLAMSIVGKTAGGTIEWMTWFKAMLPMGIILFLLVPVVCYFVIPPKQKEFPDTPAWAAGELHKLGPVTRKEILMLLVALGALIGWIFGGKLINATMVALAGICVMLIVDIVKWDDITANKSAWNTLTWFATLVAMAGGLARVGFLKWLAGVCSTYLAGHSVAFICFGLLFIFYFSHYFFASLTAHTTAMLPILLTAAMAVPGLNVMYAGMLMAGSLGLMGIITPYGTGPSPVYYNCGYIKPSQFWVLGTVFGLLFFTVYAVFGMTWVPRFF